MKTTNQHRLYAYLLGALLLLCTNACTDENLDSLNQENELIEVKLGIASPTPMNIVSSRASDDAVLNMFVFVFNDSEQLVFKQYYDDSTINKPNETYQGNTTSLNTNYVTAKVPVGKAYIYGIANINSEVYGNLYDELDAIEDRDDLMNMSLTILESARNLTRVGTTYVMAGACTDSDDVDYYTVTKGTTDIKHIKLKWIDSQITFNFSNAGNCTKFTATEWYCVNAPATTMLLEKKATGSVYADWDASNTATDFYTTYESKNRVEKNTFTFYMPENRKVAKKSITDYSQREKENLSDKLAHANYPDKPRTYVNAPDNATYIVVHGKFEGKTSGNISNTPSYNNANATANVTYVIHLGNSDDNPADFFSNRNTKYTYNVTVKGVDSIVIEVETNEENAPGATGEVTFTGESQTYILDAHYETVLLKFDVKSLWSKYRLAQNMDDDNTFKCIVSTPYTNMAGCNEAQDLAWVKFIRNENAATTLATYNSSADYLTATGLLAELENAVEDYIKYNKDVLDENDYEIPSGSIFNSSGEVTYTCFVDEFYYDKDDLPVATTSLADGGVNIWKSFVNQPDRKLYLVCSTSNSEDGESTIISSEYIFSQRSIKTFYATDPSTETVIAYGVETLNETGMLSWAPNNRNIYNWTNYNTRQDGWTNFRNLVNNANNWNTINHTENGYTSVETNKKVINGDAYLQGMATNYQRAYIACMQRNRNESGSSNNVSDADLKWYLPSIEQLQGLYLGEPVLEDAKIYNYPEPLGYTNPTNAEKRTKMKHASMHYVSSSKNSNSYRGFFILWSEEGTSVSTIQERITWGGYGQNNPSFWTEDNWYYRCVRYLGTDKTMSVDSPYSNYVELSSSNDNIIEYPLINSLLKNRTPVTGELGEHDYGDDENKLSPKGFEVRNLDRNTNVAGTSIENSQTGLITPCTNLGDNWRVPNLREFTLMFQMDFIGGKDDADKYGLICRTQFPYSYRTYWSIGNANDYNGQIQMDQLGDKHNIRCVRDVQ